MHQSPAHLMDGRPPALRLYGWRQTHHVWGALARENRQGTLVTHLAGAGFGHRNPLGTTDRWLHAPTARLPIAPSVGQPRRRHGQPGLIFGRPSTGHGFGQRWKYTTLVRDTVWVAPFTEGRPSQSAGFPFRCNCTETERHRSSKTVTVLCESNDDSSINHLVAVCYLPLGGIRRGMDGRSLGWSVATPPGTDIAGQPG